MLTLKGFETPEGSSLQFRRNELVAVLGQAGSGKETLLRVLAGLERLRGTELLVEGTSAKSYLPKDWRRYRGGFTSFVPEERDLIPHQTVAQNVELPLSIAGAPKAQGQKQAMDALAQMGLEGKFGEMPDRLSREERFWAAMARALITAPKALLIEAPVAGLGKDAVGRVMAFLKDQARQRLVVFTIEDPAQGAAHAERVLHMEAGRVVLDTAPYHMNRVQPIERKPRQEKERRRRRMNLKTALGLTASYLKSRKARSLCACLLAGAGVALAGLSVMSLGGVSHGASQVQGLWTAPALGLAVAVLGGFLGTSAAERKAEMRALRSMGASPGDVLWALRLESTLVGILTGFISILETLLLEELVQQALVAVGVTGAVLAPGWVLAFLALGLVLAWLAGWLPSGVAARRTATLTYQRSLEKRYKKPFTCKPRRD